MEGSDIVLLEYDLRVEGSVSNYFEYLISNNTIIQLDYTSSLPSTLYSNQLSSSNLKQYISFYSGAYIVDDSNINVVTINQENGTYKIIFTANYEEGENAYTGYYEEIINVIKVEVDTSNIYDLNILNAVRKEIELLPYEFNKIVVSYKSQDKIKKYYKALLNGTNDYHIEVNKYRKKYSLSIFTRY